MKRRDLIKLLESNGWWRLRRGSDHDIYTNGKCSEPVPRHTEIKEQLAKSIIRKHKLK
jgi:mRNA interferase HicA